MADCRIMALDYFKRTEDFTRNDRITKSIKLELEPTEATVRNMERDEIRKKDADLIERADRLKPLIDLAAKDHIESFLDNLSANGTAALTSVKEGYAKMISGEISGFDYKKIADSAAKDIAAKSESYKSDGKISLGQFNFQTLFAALDASLNRHRNEFDQKQRLDMEAELSNTTGALSLLGKYINSRITAGSTWMANRIIENYDIFMADLRIIENIVGTEMQDILADHTDVVNDILNKEYEKFITVSGIRRFNEFIAGIYDTEGNCISEGYNAAANRINDKNRTDTEYKGKFYRKAKKLHSQILFADGTEFKIARLTSEDEARQFIKDHLADITDNRLSDLRNVILDAGQEDIIVSGSALHTLSHAVMSLDKDAGNAGEKHYMIPELIQGYEAEKLAKKIEALKESRRSMSDAEKRAVTSEIGKIKRRMENISKHTASKNYSLSEIREITGIDCLEAVHEKAGEAWLNIIKMRDKLRSSDILTDGSIQKYHKNRVILHDLCDAYTDLKSVIRLINPKNNDRGSAVLYGAIDDSEAMLKELSRFTNLIRNYETSRPEDFAEERPICFGSPSRYSVSWWGEDVESGEQKPLKTTTAAILNMDGKYYYLINSKGAYRFRYVDDKEPHYRVRNQVASVGADKVLPKYTFTDSDADEKFSDPAVDSIAVQMENEITISRRVYETKTKKLFSPDAVKKGIVTEEERAERLKELIDLYKKVLLNNKNFKRFKFNWQPSEEYRTLKDFCDECTLSMTDITWRNVSKSDIDDAIESGKLYAFLIKNFNMYNPNAGKTSYAETFFALMDESKDNRLRLNSRPAISFRPACLDYTIEHPKGSYLVNKTFTDDRRHIPTDEYKQIYEYVNGRLEKDRLSDRARADLDSGRVRYFKTEVDRIFKKRYKEDKYFISVSYVQNADIAKKNYSVLNQIVGNVLEEDPYRTLVLARGVKDMIYYRLYDTDNSVMEEGDLNIIVNDIDYAEYLNDITREKKNKKREEWDYGVSSRGARDWYINAVIGKVAKMAVENGAVVVMEAINENFKDKMSALDNQLFTAFEKKLIAKLSAYNTKHDLDGETASLATPLQLCSGSITGSKNGIVFRVSPAYTSNTERSGFFNAFDFEKIRSQKDKTDFVSRFKSVRVIDQQKLGVTFDYRDFNTKDTVLEKTEWEVYIGKAVSVWSREDGKYIVNAAPASDIIRELNSKNLVNDQMEVDVKAFCNAENAGTAARLYDVFKLSINRRVFSDPENGRFYFNEITSETPTGDLRPGKLKAINLKKRFDTDRRS